MFKKSFVLLVFIGLALVVIGCSLIPIIIDQNPVAVISAPSRAQPGQAVLVSAASSYSPSGTAITSFEWNFGDGTPMVPPSVVPTASHTYSQGGNYFLTLVVRNANGLRSNPSTVLLSVNHRPVALARISQELPPGGQLVHPLREGFVPKAFEAKGIVPVPTYEYWKLDASESYDQDGLVLNYHWQWSDHDLGNNSIIWVRVLAGDTYQLILEVFDNEGARGWNQVSVGAIG